MIEASLAMKVARKKSRSSEKKPLAGQTLAMIFDKPSTRTRVSFDVAMRQLGGETIVLTGPEMQLGRGETIADTARVMSRYVDCIMIRTLDHDMVAELARYATIPVINGLTKFSHPCQVMADVMTFEEHRGPIRGRTVAWTGDSNNVLTSWMHAAERFEFTLKVANPPELKPKKALLDWIKKSGRGDPDHGRSGKGRRRRRLRRHRHLGLDGRRAGQGQPPQSAQTLPGECEIDVRREAGRAVHALPARASGRGSDRRGHGRAAFRRLRRGREPLACAEGHSYLVPERGWQ